MQTQTFINKNFNLNQNENFEQIYHEDIKMARKNSDETFISTSEKECVNSDFLQKRKTLD